MIFAWKDFELLINLCVSTPTLNLKMPICMICNCSLGWDSFSIRFKPAAKIVCGVDVPVEGPYPLLSTNAMASWLSMLSMFTELAECYLQLPTSQWRNRFVLRRLRSWQSNIPNCGISIHWNGFLENWAIPDIGLELVRSSQLTQTRVVWLWHPPRMDSASLGISTKPTISSFLIMCTRRLAGRRLHVEIICTILRVTRTSRRWAEHEHSSYYIETIMNTTYSVLGIVRLGNQNTQKSLILSMASYCIIKVHMFSFLLWPWQ